jgi:hypothetical protein
MPQPVGQSSAAPLHRNACPHRMESLPASNVTPAHIRPNPSRAPHRARNEMMLLDILFTLFLTHVGSLTTVKSNQRRFAPTPAHIAGIKCPHHRNKHWGSRILAGRTQACIPQRCPYIRCNGYLPKLAMEEYERFSCGVRRVLFRSGIY